MKIETEVLLKGENNRCKLAKLSALRHVQWELMASLDLRRDMPNSSSMFTLWKWKGKDRHWWLLSLIVEFPDDEIARIYHIEAVTPERAFQIMRRSFLKAVGGKCRATPSGIDSLFFPGIESTSNHLIIYDKKNTIYMVNHGKLHPFDERAWMQVDHNFFSINGGYHGG